MGILLSRLLIILNDKDPDSTDYFIALTLLMNFKMLSDMTINEVAKKCYVSKSKISKFIRTINFEDYSDFKAAAAASKTRKGYELNYNKNIMEYVEKNSIKSYTEILHKDIDECINNIDIDKIDELVKYLVEYDKVAAFGLLFSEMAALDLQAKLSYNGKFIITNLDDVKQDRFIKRSKEDTLVIIYSNSGLYIKKYMLDEFQLNKNFSNLKSKIVLITSNKEMINDPLIDLCITFNHTSDVQTHSVAYQLINDFITLRYRSLKK